MTDTAAILALVAVVAALASMLAFAVAYLVDERRTRRVCEAYAAAIKAYGKAARLWSVAAARASYDDAAFADHAAHAATEEARRLADHAYAVDAARVTPRLVAAVEGLLDRLPWRRR